MIERYIDLHDRAETENGKILLADLWPALNSTSAVGIQVLGDQIQVLFDVESGQQPPTADLATVAAAIKAHNPLSDDSDAIPVP